jgi:hypothetical protein
VLFAKAENKVTAASQRKKSSKADLSLLAKFKGAYPPSMQRIMTGECVAPNLGFHKIALQIAITSNALGKTEDQMLEACAGIIEKHQSDRQRFNTPAVI